MIRELVKETITVRRFMEDKTIDQAIPDSSSVE